VASICLPIMTICFSCLALIYLRDTRKLQNGWGKTLSKKDTGVSVWRSLKTGWQAF
jgi:hypothetical protein